MKKVLFSKFALYGLVLSAVAPVAHAEKFTIAVISDTQNYVDVTKAQPLGSNTFNQQMQYLVDTKDTKNLVFATHVGDIVQHGNGVFNSGGKSYNTSQEWDYAAEAMSKLSKAGITYGVAPGNHDYDNYSSATGSRPLSGSTSFDKYFGSNTSNAGQFGMNSYQVFTGGGQKFINLSLEHEPTVAALNWAQGVIDANKGTPTIITTHEWIDPNFKGTNARSNDYNSYFKGTDHQTPDQVWNNFVSKNDQIFMVFSGHDFTGTVNGVSNGENMRIDQNDAGHDVYQFVTDYQGNTIGTDGKAGSAIGGAGWLRFVEFDTDTKSIHSYTYSTLLDKYAGQNGENTFGVPASYSDFTLPFTAQMQPVPEPESYAMLLAGLGLIVGVARRKSA